MLFEDHHQALKRETQQKTHLEKPDKKKRGTPFCSRGCGEGAKGRCGTGHQPRVNWFVTVGDFKLRGFVGG